MSAVVEGGLNATGNHPASEQTILKFLLDIRMLRSVAEFGCGTASWLRAARYLGTEVIRGFDDEDMPAAARMLRAEEFLLTDFVRHTDPGRRYDLAICLEGANRVGAERAANLVETLCAASDWVLFGAGVPYLQAQRTEILWTEIWARLFLERGYACYDILRRRFWHDARVAYRYRQSLCLYVRAGAHYALKARGHVPTRCPQSMIHPELFLEVAGGMPPGRDVAALVRAYYEAAGRVPGGKKGPARGQ